MRPIRLPAIAVAGAFLAGCAPSCGDVRSISTDDLIRAVVAETQVGRKSFETPSGETVLFERWLDPDDYIAEFPDCCGLYTGPVHDHYQPPTWWQKLWGWGKYVVRITARQPVYDSAGGYTLAARDEYYVLDVCGKIVAPY